MFKKCVFIFFAIIVFCFSQANAETIKIPDGTPVCFSRDNAWALMMAIGLGGTPKGYVKRKECIVIREALADIVEWPEKNKKNNVGIIEVLLKEYRKANLWTVIVDTSKIEYVKDSDLKSEIVESDGVSSKDETLVGCTSEEIKNLIKQGYTRKEIVKICE